MEEFVAYAIETFNLKRNDIPQVRVLRIGWGNKIRRGVSISGDPLILNGQVYERGFGDHAQSELLVTLPSQGASFEAVVGVSDIQSIRSLSTPVKMIFMVEIGGRIVWQSRVLCVEDDPVRLQIALEGTTEFKLIARQPDFPADFKECSPLAHANWCNPVITLQNGKIFQLGTLPIAGLPDKLGPDFNYDGRSFAACPWTWTYGLEMLASDSNCDVYRSSYTAPDHILQLQLTVKIYKDFPVVEWLPELVNIGNQPSSIVDDFQSLAIECEVQSKYKIEECKEVNIRRAFGAKSRRDDFVDQPFKLQDRYPHNRMVLDTDEGRSSAAWLPFFGIDCSDQYGFNVGIGWSGAWKAQFHLNDLLTVKAGMMQTHFRVLPGERIRQPSIFLQYRDGLSILQGQNQLRQFLLKYHSPRDARDEIIRTPLSVATWGGLPTADSLAIIQKIEDSALNYDTFWIDAGWYGPDREVGSTEFKNSDWHMTVGDWRVNQIPHPGGLRPIADEVHALGMKFLLWVEIERIMPGTPVALAHPDWTLNVKNDSSSGLLLNLGKKKALDWAVETVTTLVRDEGIDYYRQDFNFNTIPYWAEHDSPDRQGITEAKYVAGLYEFWDTLRKRFPNMLIDNCASGGRRIDFETMSRSICLWRDDLLGRPWFDSCEVNHTEVHYLTQWVPLHAGGVNAYWGDDYAFLSGVASGASWFYSEFKEDYSHAWLKEMIVNVRRMMKYFYKDFYPLTPYPENLKAWNAYQCHCPQSVLVFSLHFVARNVRILQWFYIFRPLTPMEITNLKSFKATQSQSKVKSY
jgi:alpha-galactosidase